MKLLRTLVLASLAVLVAACSSTPVAPPAPKGPDLTGNWVISVTSQMGVQDSELVLQQTGKQLGGTITGQAGSAPITGTVDANAVAFSFTINAQGMELKIDQIGTLQPDGTIAGKAVFGTFGEGTFVARKK